MFREGLPRGLNKAIFDHHPRPPTSLRALVQLACDQHHNWLTFVIHFRTGSKKNKGPIKDRARSYQQQNNQPDDAIDVDNVTANALTTEEKADCLKRGLCFFCKKSSHMTRNCPKKQNRGTRPTQCTIKEVTTVESTPVATVASEKEGLHEQMKKLPQEECQKLLDAMLEEEGF
jgi:hypothetical protein